MNNYKQSGNGLLGDVQPGSRVKDAIDRIRGSGNGPDMSQATEMMPNNPGPRALGRTPAVGKLRRDRDIPVVRDQIPELLD